MVFCMRLLLIEDDQRLVRTLAAGLEEEGFSIDTCEDGSAGLRALLSHPYDACVLDIGLPGLDGFAVLAEARARKVAVPILMLTARDAVADRLQGLDRGADDYLIKPFAFAELLSRLRAILRRSTAQRSTVLTLGAVRLDVKSHETSVDGARVALTQKQFALLEYLLLHEGEVVTRAMLLSGVWGYSFDPGTNLVDVHVAQLRRKIEETGHPCPIETVRGIGYRAVARAADAPRPHEEA